MRDGLAEAGVEPPPEVASRLAASSLRIARQNLELAVESARIERLFGTAGVPILFVKGVTLAALAYATLALKMGRDIDLLVPPDRVATAAGLLEQAGYRRITPGPEIGDERLLVWHRHWKESVWQHRERPILVELHSALVDNPRLLPGVGADGAVRRVEVAKGLSLPTLERDALFAYLCVHGASSAWSRLKWIADLNALIAGEPPEEVERLYRRSQELGAGRAAAQALLLAARLFDPPVPPHLLAQLGGDWRNRHLLRIGLAAMTGPNETQELDERLAGTLPVHWMQFFLLPGLRFKFSELARKAVSPYDRAELALPKPLAFLYPLLLVPNWLRRKRRERRGT